MGLNALNLILGKLLVEAQDAREPAGMDDKDARAGFEVIMLG